MPVRSDDVGVSGSVLSRCGIAAADMATGEAQTELHPSSADAKALLAALWGARHDGPNHRETGTPDRQPADREAHPGAPSVKPGPGGSGNRSHAAVRC